MSIPSEIERIENNIASTYSALADFGVNMPSEQNSNNLPSTVAELGGVFATKTEVANQYVAKTGGNMTGPLTLGKNAYIKNQGESSSVTTYQCPAMFNIHSMTTVGTIDINLGNKVGFHALDFTLASYSMNISINMSGYGYVSNTFLHSPKATGVCDGFVPKLRVAVDVDGNRHWLFGEVTTNWGGYVRAGITKYIKMSGDHNQPNVSISFLTDETDLFTWQKEVPINNILPYNPVNLSAPVPVEKGGTGATNAQEALTNLGIVVPTKTSELDNDSGYVTDTEVNNAIADKAPAYTYGTSDLTAGTSELETGKLYFVYE